jgi:hypothetical protein
LMHRVVHGRDGNGACPFEEMHRILSERDTAACYETAGFEPFSA